jgi:hypothetical protein
MKVELYISSEPPSWIDVGERVMGGGTGVDSKVRTGAGGGEGGDCVVVGMLRRSCEVVVSVVDVVERMAGSASRCRPALRGCCMGASTAASQEQQRIIATTATVKLVVLYIVKHVHTIAADVWLACRMLIS